MKISVTPATNGFIVEAGCQILVFNDPAHLISEFARWVAHPAHVEAEYIRKFDGTTGGIDLTANAAVGEGAMEGSIGRIRGRAGLLTDREYRERTVREAADFGTSEPPRDFRPGSASDPQPRRG